MSKLWIVHRRPEMRAALARASELPGTEIVAGAPLPGEAFAEARSPAAILIALEDDFEQELEFAHRERERLRHARWIVLCDRSDAEEASRLFDLDRPEILTHPLDPRALRAEIARAWGARRVESLAQREQRERVAARFSAWLGGLEVPGLLRALDPALASLPLLVRGAAGSGRALLARYVELFRGARGRILRLDARSLDDVQALPERLAEAGPGLATLWLDEVDALSAADQRTLAEWIRHDAPPAAPGLSGLRWVATAGADDLYATLEPALERAFAPLVLAVPAIAAHPETLGRFAEAVATEWTRSVGGPARHFAPEAIEALSRLRWAGDRAELEAVLRSSLAAAARERVEASDLRFPTGEPLPAGHPVAQTGPETTAEATAAPEPIETAIMEPASEAELEGLAIVDAEEEEAIDRAFDQALDPSWTHAAGSTADAAEPAPAPTPEPTAAAADRAALEQAYAEGAQAGPDDLRADAAETDASAAPPDDFDESARLAASALEAAGADDLGAALADDGLAAAAGSGASSAPASDADAPGAGAGAGTSPSTPPAPPPRRATSAGGGWPAACPTRSATPSSRSAPSRSCSPSTSRTRPSARASRTSSARTSGTSTRSSRACRASRSTTASSSFPSTSPSCSSSCSTSGASASAGGACSSCGSSSARPPSPSPTATRSASPSRACSTARSSRCPSAVTSSWPPASSSAAPTARPGCACCCATTTRTSPGIRRRPSPSSTRRRT